MGSSSSYHRPQKNCLGALSQFLTEYHCDGSALLSQIITANQTWVHIPELKNASMAQCEPDGKKGLKKVMVKKSAGKLMAIVCWHSEGVFQTHYIPKGVNINSLYRRCHKKTSYVSNFTLSFYCMNGSIEGRCTNYKNSSVCNPISSLEVYYWSFSK